MFTLREKTDEEHSTIRTRGKVAIACKVNDVKGGE